MSVRTFISFNINGIRAGFRKGLREWISAYCPDLIGLQETKAWMEQLKEQEYKLENYYFYLSKCSRKGYSGVGIYCKKEPLEICYDFFENPHFDDEGRVIMLRFDDCIVLNVYFPNGVSGKERLAYKMAFYEEFLAKVRSLLEKGEKVVVMGDVNTAHKPIDLSRPKENMKNSGFLPEERDWIDRFLSAGMIDTYRYFFPDKAEMYSWWDLKTSARERNIGWRIDYIFCSENLSDSLVSAEILTDVPGSDHCPVEVKIDIS